MRYQVDSENYLTSVNFGCTTGACVEYIGAVPENYDTIEEWYEDNCECVRAWKIVDGDLEYDSSRDYKLQILYEQQAQDNAHISKKEMGMASTEEINPYTDLYPSQQSAGGYITGLSETFNKVGNLPTEEVNLSILEEQNLDLIELEFIGNNFLPNNAVSSVNNGIEYEQNIDKTINIRGAATDKSTLNLAGTNTSVRNILTFKANTKYMLSGLEGLNLEFYHYDGTDRTLIGVYSGGTILFDKDINITQVVLVVEKGAAIQTTIKPMLQLVNSEHPIIPMIRYSDNLYDVNNISNIANYVTVDDDGWITVTYDNSSGTSTVYVNHFTKNLNLNTSTKYNIITEIKEVSGTGSLLPVSQHQKQGQFTSSTFYNFTDLLSNSIRSAIKTTEDNFDTSKWGLRTYVQFLAGQSGSITFRISVLENTFITADTFEYKKHLGRDGQYYVDGISTQEIRSGLQEFNFDKYKADLLNNFGNVIDGTYNNFTITKNLASTMYASLFLKENTKYYIKFNWSCLKGNQSISIEYSDGTTRILTSDYSATSKSGSINFETDETKTLTKLIFTLYSNDTNYVISDLVISSNVNAEIQAYGVSPSPDYPSEITNIYPAGTYNAIADNKIYTFTISEDLRSAGSIADRLWIDVDNGIDIERKVGKDVLDGVTNKFTTKSGSINNVIWMSNNSYNVPDYGGVISSHFVGGGNLYYKNLVGIYLENNRIKCGFGLNTELTTLELANDWLSTHNVEVQYELATYTTSHIEEYSYSDYEYEEYKNNTTLIDLAGNKLTIPDKITIKDNQIVLIKGNDEIYLGDTVMPRTYTPYTHAYCHQKVFIDFKYKDPRNVDITKITLKGLLSITDIETEYNFTQEDLNIVRNYIVRNIDLTPEQIEYYDVNGDGVVDIIDSTRILGMVNGVKPNKIKGTLEINSTKSQRTIVLRGEDGNILTSVGLNGITTPSLSLEGRKVYGETILYSGESNGDLTLRDDVSNYEYIEIFYKNNTYGDMCSSVKVHTPNNKNVNLQTLYPNLENNRMYVIGTQYLISGNELTYVTGYGLAVSSESVYGLAQDTISITRVIGYK